MKKYLLSILTTFLISILPITPAFAQTPATSPNPKQQQRQENQISNLKNRADREIDRRVSSLNNLINRINNMKKLSSSEKTTLTNEVQTEITNLNNLKSKIAADTDLATLKIDVQSIVNSYRVYLLFMPQIRIISAADRILAVVDKYTDLESKIQTRIQQAQSAGKDVSSLQTTFTDMQNKVNDAKTQATNAQTAVEALTPQGYPGNKSTLQNARQMIVTAIHDLNDAWKDANTLRQGLKGIQTTGGKSIASPNSSPNPSP